MKVNETHYRPRKNIVFNVSEWKVVSNETHRDVSEIHYMLKWVDMLLYLTNISLECLWPNPFSIPVIITSQTGIDMCCEKLGDNFDTLCTDSKCGIGWISWLMPYQGAVLRFNDKIYSLCVKILKQQWRTTKCLIIIMKYYSSDSLEKVLHNIS